MELGRIRRALCQTLSKESVLCFLVIIVVLFTSFFVTETQALDQGTNLPQRHRTTRATHKYSVSGEDIEEDEPDEEATTLPPPPSPSPHLRRAQDRLLDKLHTFNATTTANVLSLARPKKNTLDDDIDENDFCSHAYVDSAYYNGYDYILTRGDRLWYYYRNEHRLSRAYDQRKFTQGKFAKL